MKLTQKQFNQIFALVEQIQRVCEDADTSSINMWLCKFAPETGECESTGSEGSTPSITTLWVGRSS